jgi:hypothetical protein
MTEQEELVAAMSAQLPGKTIQRITDTHTHGLCLVFTDGTLLKIGVLKLDYVKFVTHKRRYGNRYM